MKVGTDAVMLGAWVDLYGVSDILEVGTGCGIIALMLAQRAEVLIDAIDMDESSVNEADNNFKNSAFSNNLRVFHYNFRDYFNTSKKKYDLIVSNPPFFENNLISLSEKRALARHAVNLSFGELLYGSKILLKPDGKLCIILPVAESQIFENRSKFENFYCHSKLFVKPKPSKAVKRVLTQLATY